ncbi:murein biosynthesis integral membrane protein MurJ [Brevibacterium album]|uniref:murein biosynthesis integral membrane protein MurJ n=1 Tax=Brevibacterium album TaxID=417948 RepID=UPI000424C642|nr:murein biosynthesis integral membrane protein MurJ [Brevibacterium album]
MADSRLSSLAKSSALMAAGTLVSRILGFVKAALLIVAIGVAVGGTADAFDVANKIPNTLYMLLSGGVINAVLVPQIVRAAKRPDGGKDFIDRLLTLAITALAAITLLATLCAPLLVQLYSSPRWSDDQRALAVAFAFWCLPQIFFYGLYTMLGQVLNAKSNFGPYMWAPALNNVISIAGLATFIALFGRGDNGEHPIVSWDGTMIAVLAASATLGVMGQALILLWPLARIGYMWRPRFGFRGVGLGRAGHVAGWAFAMMLIGQLAFVVTSRVASTATSDGTEASASNAAYTTSYLIFMLPHSIVAVSLATALFTQLSTYAADRDADSVRTSLGLGLRLVGFVNVFAMSGLMVLSVPAAMVITGGGSMANAQALAPVVVTMLAGLVPFSANYLLQRVFYAYEDAKTPFWVQVPATLVTVAGVLCAGALLPTTWIVAGIGLAMSTGYLVSTVLSAVLLRRRLGTLGLGPVLIAHAKFLLAGVVSGCSGFLVLHALGQEAYSSLPRAFVTCVLLAGGMLVVYAGLCWLLRVRELHQITDTLRSRLRR